MDEKKMKEGIREELSVLQQKIGTIYVHALDVEIRDVLQEVRRMSQNIEQAFIENLREVPRGTIAKMVERVNSQVEVLMRESSAGSRKKEFEETRSNSGYLLKNNVEEVKTEAERFKEEGIVKDNRCEFEIEDICNRIIKAYQGLFEKTQAKRGDKALYEAKQIVNRSKNRILETREGYSEVIKRKIKSSIDEMEINLSEREKALDQKKVDSDFLAKTEGAVRSEEEQDEFFAGVGVSQNEAKFKDIKEHLSQEQKDEIRRKNEAMFK